VSYIYVIGLHAARCFIDLCLDLAYYTVWDEGSPPESAPHTVSELDIIFGMEFPGHGVAIYIHI